MTIRRENNLPHICAPGVDVDIISHKTTITTPDFKNPESNYDITTHFNPNIQINPHRTQEASFKGTHTAYWITGLSTIFGPDIVRKIISKIATVRILFFFFSVLLIYCRLGQIVFYWQLAFVVVFGVQQFHLQLHFHFFI